jgi:hypothetical protein
MEDCYVRGVKRRIPKYKELKENENYTAISVDSLITGMHYFMTYSDPNSSVYWMKVLGHGIYLLSNNCISLDPYNNTEVDKDRVDKDKKGVDKDILKYNNAVYNLEITMDKKYRIVKWDDPKNMAKILPSTVKLVHWNNDAFNAAGAKFYIDKVNGGNRKKSGTKGRRTRKNKRSRRNRRK